MAVVGTIVGLSNGMTVTNFTTVVEEVDIFSGLFTAIVATAFAYEGWIIGLCILNIGIFLSFFGIGYAFNVFFLGFSLGMIFVFPPYFMLLRRKIFNESNNLTCKENIGFNPKFYWLLGIFCGFFTLVNSFWYLQSFYTLNYPSFFVCLCFIIFSIIWAALVLSPDIWNKFLPFEIRSTKGFFIYSILMIILSFLASNLFNALA